MPKRLEPEKAIQQITGWLQTIFKERLVSLVLYGSAALGHELSDYSDLNLLCVLDRIDAAALQTGAPAVRWWREQGNPPLVLLSRDEQADAADVFPIEYLDIQANHRVLAGEDVFANVPRHPQLHRLHVEHDLRSRLIRLRGAFMSTAPDSKAVGALLLESVGSFITLFRHALVAAGEPLCAGKQATVEAAAHYFSFSAEPFTRLLQARRGQPKLTKEEVLPLFSQYLEAIQKVERSLEQMP